VNAAALHVAFNPQFVEVSANDLTLPDAIPATAVAFAPDATDPEATDPEAAKSLNLQS